MGIDEKVEVPDGPLDVATDSNNGDNLVCPPHTTDRKLMWRIDLHVVPFLCIMYLLAFLGKFNCALSRRWHCLRRPVLVMRWVIYDQANLSPRPSQHRQCQRLRPL